MKYIKLFENWLTIDDHIENIDNINPISLQPDKKNKLENKFKNSYPSKSIDIKNSKWIKLERDKVDNITDIESKNVIIVSKNNKKTGLAIFIYVHDISKSYENLYVSLSIQARGASPCVENGSEVKILFTDGSRISLSSNNIYNCDERVIINLTSDDVNVIKTKKIETMRVFTSLGKYVQEDFSIKNQEDFYNTINAISDYMDTLVTLHIASKFNRLEMVKYLIEGGYNPNLKDDFNFAPIHYAIEKNNYEIVNFLVEKGADVNIKDNAGKTPLHYAIENDSLKYTKFLVEKGADVNIKDNAGKTPIEYALEKRENKRGADYMSDIINFLIESGAEEPKQPSPDDIIKAEENYRELVFKTMKDYNIQKVIYPEMAKRAGIEGKVIIKALIGKDGRAKTGQTIIKETPSELLNSAAIKVIMAQVFPPPTVNGKPTEIWVDIPVNFKIR